MSSCRKDKAKQENKQQKSLRRVKVGEGDVLQSRAVRYGFEIKRGKKK